MIDRLWEILYELYMIVMQRGEEDIWVPPVVTMFTYDQTFAPNDNIQHQMVDFDCDVISDMIDEFTDLTDSLEFWTNLVGSSDNPEHKEHIEWEYSPEGRQYPTKFIPLDLPLHLAFQFYIDLNIKMNKNEEDEPLGMYDLYKVIGAYLYILLASATPADRERFYKHISGVEDFVFVNHDNLLHTYIQVNDIRNIII